MRWLCLIALILLLMPATGQGTLTPDQIKAQMTKIRQTTDWNNPDAAQKANSEIKRLALLLTGGKAPTSGPTMASEKINTPKNLAIKATNANEIQQIAYRHFQQCYKQLDPAMKNQFDMELQQAKKAEFNANAICRLTSLGAFLLQFGPTTSEAGAYLSSAILHKPSDTLSINNFGAYLRSIDSVKTALTVHLYGLQLCPESPVVLTQIGCGYFELKDFKNSEKYLGLALEYAPDFGQAQTALCDLYLATGRWREALRQLLTAATHQGVNYLGATNRLGAIRSASKNRLTASAGNPKTIYQDAMGNDSKESFWNEKNLGFNIPDLLSPPKEGNATEENNVLSSLVPEENHLKMPNIEAVNQLEEWTHGGGYSKAVQAFTNFNTLQSKFNSDFLEIHRSIPPLAPNVLLRDYPSERFILECLLEYFSSQSNEMAQQHIETISPFPAEASTHFEIYLEKHQQYQQELQTCMMESRVQYEECRLQCTKYPKGSEAKEVCERNCIGQNDYRESECNRLFCSHDCEAAKVCNTNMNGIYNQFTQTFIQNYNLQKDLLDQLYSSADPWIKKMESPYWSKLYAYEINRVALLIIGNAYTVYTQAFPPTAISSCGTNCSDYVAEPPVPIDEVIPKEPKGNTCTTSGKHEISLGNCDLGFDCESIEFGCTHIVSASVKRNFRKKTTTGFLGLGVKGEAGVLSASAKAGFEITVSDQSEIEDVGAKMDINISAGKGMAKISGTSSATYSVMTGLNANPEAGFSLDAK